jgi:hydrogenase/urease accessory protein HupE
VASDWVLRPARVLAAGAAACAATTRADAHLTNIGFGPFYDGLAHPLLTVEDLLPIVAMALLAGLGGASVGRRATFALPAAWLAGMIAGRLLAVEEPAAVLTPLLTIALGASVAADRKPPVSVVVGTALILGLIHGWQNGVGLARAGAGATGLLGILCAIFVVATIVAGGVVQLRAAWTRIVVRVAGSWIAAIGMLMLGWSLRGNVR